MKKAIFLMVFFLVALTMFGQEFTFRGLPWGSSVEDIIAKEGKPDSNTHGQLIYQNIRIAGYNNAMLLFYCDAPNSAPYSEKYGLQCAQYTIGVINKNANTVYNDLFYKLGELYGSPILGSKPGLKSSDRYFYWVVSKTKITLTLLVDVKMKDVLGTFIIISYYSPDWIANEYGDL